MVREWCSAHSELLDEAQLEVSRSLVTFKTFGVKTWKESVDGKIVESSEAKEAKAAATAYKVNIERETGKKWSDVMKGPKGYFIGYCRAGELAVEAVVEAGRHYKLNVDLSAGYMLGRNWAECH